MRSPTSIARLAVVAAAFLLVTACGSDKKDTAETGSTTTEAASVTSTTAGATTTTEAQATTTTQPEGQPETAIWPFVDNEIRFSDPVDAATSFASDYLGFPDPHPGEFQAGDARSGEVPMQPKATGPTTTILVRQASTDDTWWVIGANTPSIALDSPTATSQITSPVEVTGQSTAFEATVNAEIRADGSIDPLVEDFFMGGANGEMGPFSKEITFDKGSATAGAIVLKTLSAEDGSTQEATVVKVTFA